MVYDFTAAGFDQTGWQKIEHGGGSVTITENVGLQFPKADNAYRLGYAIANPLKGKVTDGFTVILNAAVTDDINDLASIFGFNKTADPNDDPFNFFFLAATGINVRLNINDADQGQAAGIRYYDITGGTALDMKEVSRLTLSVSQTAITIYLGNEQVANYPWNANGDKAAYSYDTLSFVNEAEYFNLGVADSIWGNAAITIENVSLYNYAIADNLANFTAITEKLTELQQSFSPSNYKTEEEGWQSAYTAFTEAWAAAQALDLLTSTQTQVNSALDALNSAYTALEPFRYAADITRGLISAFPLNSANGGKNIVTGASQTEEDQIRYMGMNNAAGDMTDLRTLTAENGRFGTYQGVEAALLFEEEALLSETSGNPFADRGTKECTLGLDIPTSAFTGVTAEGGFTLSLNVYIENTYAGWVGRIFQLGEYSFINESKAQFFLTTDGALAMDKGNGNESVGVIPNTTNMGGILAKQWYSVSLAVNPAANTIVVYITGYGLDENGAINEITWTHQESISHADITLLIQSITSDTAENWIGRSFWDTADPSMVGAVNNLTVYDRVLLPEEVTELHATSDLPTLVGA